MMIVDVGHKTWKPAKVFFFKKNDILFRILKLKLISIELHFMSNGLTVGFHRFFLVHPSIQNWTIDIPLTSREERLHVAALLHGI